MENHVEVLIVGAGPTGLMMACQLLRFGIQFRIIDKQSDRTHESRAIGIQAKSMEIFQNLGLGALFLNRAQTAKEILLYLDGKEKLKLNFKNFHADDTPFPSVYFLPQPETEKILLDHLEKNQIHVERSTELVSFFSSNNEINASIKNILTREEQKITCQYLIGCDGAHSLVRHTLGFEFMGASYKQDFILADGKVEWPLDGKSEFRFFAAKKGIFAHIPLKKEVGRIMAAMTNHFEQSSQPLTVSEIEQLGRDITKMPIKLTDVVWISRFHLHHRAVKQYSKDRAFLAGDSAHIHTPVGAQGMNTGLQDVTNLAWKLAFVLKKISPTELLETYQAERQPVGETLVRTTDRTFGLLTATGIKGHLVRRFLLPIILGLINKLPQIQKKLFTFVSQLHIRYEPNAFLMDADNFLAGPKAGARAPDAPIKDTTLFELFRRHFCYLLIFKSDQQQDPEREKQIQDLKDKYKNLIGIHEIKKSVESQIAFDRYGITNEAIYFIRPDGYIGFRCNGLNLEALSDYLRKLITIRSSFP